MRGGTVVIESVGPAPSPRTVPIQPDGSYSAVLPVGEYRLKVDVQPGAVDCGFLTAVSVTANADVHADIGQPCLD
jgi:hypothetical protein